MVRINASSNYPRKRRKGLTVSQSDISVVPPDPCPISTDLTLGANQRRVLQNNHNRFSYTSLLIHGHGGDEESFPDLQLQTQMIIESQSENLRRTLENLYKEHYTAQENESAKRIKEKEMELEVEAKKSQEFKAKETFMMQTSEFWKIKARRLEDELKRLTEELKNVSNMRRGAESTEEETCSSSWTGEGEEVGMKVACGRCAERTATVMAWPCRARERV